MPTSLPLTQAGRIDVAALDQWPLDEVRAWVLSRLKGQDALWPVDHSNFETPDALFVRLWRDADAGSLFVERLGRACADLLRLAWGSAPAEWMDPLFHLVATTRPEACHQFLNVIALHHDDGFSDQLRAAKLDRAWLRTLAAYDPQTAELVKVWRQLLHDPRYVDIAYHALSHDLIMAVWCLPEYYQALTPAERSVLLPEAVRDLLRWGTSTALEALGKYRAKLGETPGLCDVIDAALAKMEEPPAFKAAPAAAPPADQGTKSAPANGSCVLAGIATEAPSARVAA